LVVTMAIMIVLVFIVSEMVEVVRIAVASIFGLRVGS